jgi:hypothetical protein
MVIIVPMWIKCKGCSKKFLKRPWPATRNVWCSRECQLRAYNKEHRGYYEAWVAANPKKVQRNKAKYREVHREELREKNREYAKRTFKESYARRYGTIEQRRVIYARQRARRKLLKCSQPVCSQAPHGGCQGRVECHHRDENPHNDALANLVWLCKLHHAQAHRKV